MCNLYANNTPQAEMRKLFAVDHANDHLGNQDVQPAIYPAYPAPVVRINEDGKRELVPMHWGFLMAQTSKKTGNPIQPRAVNNARDDKLDGRFWNASFRDRRCLVPASSFCEMKGRSPNDYYWLGLKGDATRPSFAFAGIWRNSKGTKSGHDIDGPTHSIVTSSTNDLVKDIHPDRLVVILRPDDYDQWLNGTEEEARALVKPCSALDMKIFKHGEDEKSDSAY
jgi:putative SOS response-associated peptidase YedK